MFFFRWLPFGCGRAALGRQHYTYKMNNNLSYLVLYVSDIDKSFQFYSGLGFKLTNEKHGNGPDHYSIKMDHCIIELYPSKNGKTSLVRIGIYINDYNGLKLVSDPDGNKLEIL